MERKVVVTNLEQDKEQSTSEEKKAEVSEETVIDPKAEAEVEEAKAEVSGAEVEETEEEVKTDAIEEESHDADLVADESDKEQMEELPEENENTAEEVGSSDYYKNILVKAEEFVSQTDWAFVSNELANLALHIEEGPESSSEEAKEAISQFATLRDQFEEKKRLHYEELNKRKAENLEAKKELLKKFADIISEEKWSATKEVSQIRGKWDSIKLIPHNEVDTLNEKFEALLAEFESHKVDRLVKKLQKEEENLTMKLLILDKIDTLNTSIENENADFKELNKEFQDLLTQWRKIGRVPAEKNQQTWDHFNKSQDAFNELRFKNDKEYRKSVEKSLEKKKKLIKEAEALMDEEDIAIAARQVNKLHNLWKKTGNLPQKEENELWEIFKSATDAFNDKKAENLDVLRDQEQENLEAKLSLIEKAKSFSETDSYEDGHQALQKLMEEWKKIGPVPRKKSSKVWTQFKSAMDDFYEKRREHFKDVRKDQKENLNKKNELIAKLEELGSHEDPAVAVQEAKKIQDQFKDIGHVPLKFKNKIWKQYREVCDNIYNRFRSSGADLGMERELASEGIEPAARKEIIKYQKELEVLKKDISKLEGEIIQFQEAKTYFKPTNKGNKLIEELQSKVDKAEKGLDKKKERLSELKRLIRDIKTSGED